MKIKTILSKLILVFSVTFLLASPAYAAPADQCGNSGVELSINIGCTGSGNAIIDMLKAITRFFSAGVGLVIAASIIIAGIQYMTSAGNPQALAAAKGRIANSLIALLIFFFLFAIIQFLIPTDF